MINANIFDGDYVVVRQQQVADNGDIVAALIAEEEATVKTFYRVDGHVWLMTQNPSYEPMLGDNSHIMGKVVMKIPLVCLYWGRGSSVTGSLLGTCVTQLPC